MVEFFLSGGIAMVPVLVVGLLTLYTGARGKTQRLIALSVAMVALGVGGAALDLMVALQFVASQAAAEPEMAMIGISESLSPVVLTSGLVALAWLLAGARAGATGTGPLRETEPTPAQSRLASS